MSKSRVERAKALEEWAERVEFSDLEVADTEALRTIAELTGTEGGLPPAPNTQIQEFPHIHNTL